MKSIKVWMICGAVMVAAALAGCGNNADEGGGTGNAATGNLPVPRSRPGNNVP